MNDHLESVLNITLIVKYKYTPVTHNNNNKKEALIYSVTAS